MSMAVKTKTPSYALLLGIDINHAYYADGVCPDFITKPSSATQQWLAGHRCVVKPKINGVEIYIQTDGQGNPFIAFGDQEKLSFELALRNADFLLFTDKGNLPNGKDANTQITFYNPNNPGNALVEITRNFNPMTSERVSIAFQAKLVRWIYYLLTSTDDLNDYLIGQNANPAPYTWTSDNGNDDLKSGLAKQSPNFKISRFLSDQMIPCQESGIKNIQLTLKGSQTTTTLIDHLPNPYYRNFLQTDDVASAGNKIDAIYHIMTQLNTTT
ncbi:MAG: hypothetical protein WCI11_16410 [Candidatus Methylumidiphilus sp.]